MPMLQCPICRRAVPYRALSEVPYRPFCSQRCQLIDLGKWLNEEYRVSEPLPDFSQSRPQAQAPEGRPADEE